MLPIAACIVALLLAHQLTPVVRVLAWRMGVIDAPNPENPGKIHRIPTPLAGGLAIYVATFIAVLLLGGLSRELVALGVSATMLVTIGLLDDIVVLDWRPRILVQTVAAATFLWIAAVEIPGTGGAWWSVLLAMFWIVGVTNALNLMDNIDGASTGVAFLSAVLIFLLNPTTFAGLASLALAGACVGFLRYNSKPASIFLGDTGSLFLGFMLSALSLLQAPALTDSFGELVVFPLILGMPIFDTTLATYLRIRRGRPIYLPDRSNLTYRLFGLGLSEREVILSEYLLAAFLGFCALATLHLSGIAMYAPSLVAAGALIALGERVRRVPYPDEVECPSIPERPRILDRTSSRSAA